VVEIICIWGEVFNGRNFTEEIASAERGACEHRLRKEVKDCR
jgi:hypothetical protein